MADNNDPKGGARRGELIFSISQILFAVTSLTALLVTLSDRIRFEREYLAIAVAALFAVAYFIAAYLLIKRLRRVRRIRFRLAVTGLPRVGKTVFSILMIDSLMNERIPNVSFTGESRSVISVYQAIRNLPANIWPISTVKGGASIYSGEVEARRTIIDFELGDSAGEDWLDFNQDERRDPGFLEYVLSAHALVHVIPLDELTSEGPPVINRAVQDLLLATQLKKAIKNSLRFVPLMVVLSKADLVIAEDQLIEPNLGLFKAVQFDQLSTLPVVEEIAKSFPDSGILELLRALNVGLEDDFQSIDFVFSSASAVSDQRLVTDHRGDMLKWILAKAEIFDQGASRNHWLRALTRR